jgi:hypothetical protein
MTQLRSMPIVQIERLPLPTERGLAVLYSAEFRLPAMRHSAEFLKKISLTSLPYATQHEIQVKIFWSTLRYAA